jgi:Transposase DDE domain
MSDRVRPEPAKYKTTNWRRYNQALEARGALMIWLDRNLQWSGSASGKRGRRPLFSDAAIQFCLALRQAMGMLESLLKLAGLSWPVPDYSTGCRRQKRLTVRIPYRPAAQGLHLLVDSTGLKMIGEGEWKRKKHGAEYRRQWRKLHIGIDAQTLEIRAIEVTPNSVGDAPVLPSLLGQIDPNEALLPVSGIGAYDTKACHAAIALRQAHAIIPVRKNARKPRKENRPGARASNEILRATQRLGRDIWKRWSGYHRRSLVETKMRCVKLMGERVMARDFDRQVAELQVRAAILNRFTQLGTPETVRVG